MESDRSAVRCKRCGLESVLREHYRSAEWGFGQRGRVCPLCIAETDAEKVGWGVVAAGFGVIGLLVYLELAHSGSPPHDWIKLDDGHATLFGTLMWFPTLWALWWVLVAAHECTHAVAATAVGARVHEIRLGWGDEWTCWRPGSLRLSLGRRFLSGGYCFALFPETPTRSRITIFIAAPLLLHLAILVILGSSSGFASAGHGFMHLVFLVNLFALITTIWPRTVRLGERRLPTDGKIIWDVWRKRTSPADWRIQPLHRVGFAIRDGRTAEAVKIARAALDKNREDGDLRKLLAQAYVFDERWEEALARVDDMVDADRREPGERQTAFGRRPAALAVREYKATYLLLLDRIAEANEEAAAALEEADSSPAKAYCAADLAFGLLLGDPGTEEYLRGESLAAGACRELPWCGIVAIAQGLALCRRRRFRAALRVLKPLGRHESHAGCMGIGSAVRALALAGLGNRKQATRIAERANARALPPALVHLVERAMTPARGA